MNRHVSFSAFVIAALAAAAMFVLPDAAHAQRSLSIAAAAASEARVALVIGNGAYKHIAPLANPANDARLMAETLASVGFRLVGGRALIDADRAQMERAIRDFGQALRSGSVGLFYFAGHGIQTRGENYLIPVTANVANESDVKYELVSANLVLDEMANASNRLNLMILDACRNNPFGGRGLRSVSSGLAQVSAPAGTIISYATQPGAVAADGKGRNSPYTVALASAMRKPGIGLFDTFNSVGVAVKQATGGQQQPWVATSPIEGTFSFVPNSGAQLASAAPGAAALPAPSDSSANDRALWDSVKDSRNADELKAYLEQFPNGLFAGLARTRIRALEQTQVATAAPTSVAPPSTPAQQIGALGQPGSSFRDCDICPEMVVIPAGSFTMGSPASESGRKAAEGPQHQVSIARPFAAGKHEITRGQFARFAQEAGYTVAGACMDQDGSKWTQNPAKNWRAPGFSQTDNDPVVCVNWQDAKAYTDWLSRKTARSYRLLSEAQWEYVARAGTSTAFSFGNSISPQLANYDTKFSYAGSIVVASRGQTAPVGSYPANGFGLHDVHGNAAEWTEDCWKDNYNGAPADGSAWTSGDCSSRVQRGGTWDYYPQNLRSAFRAPSDPLLRYDAVGFRVARTD